MAWILCGFFAVHSASCARKCRMLCSVWDDYECPPFINTLFSFITPSYITTSSIPRCFFCTAFPSCIVGHFRWILSKLNSFLKLHTGDVVAEKTGELKKLENLTKSVNWKYCRCTTYCGTQQQQERQGRRDNNFIRMTVWCTSPLAILEIHSLHQVAMGTPSHVPLQRSATIIAIFRGSETSRMVLSDWDFALKCECGPNSRSI